MKIISASSGVMALALLLAASSSLAADEAGLGKFLNTVPVETGLFFCHGDTYAPANLKNLSQGGLFVTSNVTMSTGDILTLYMPNLGGGYELLFETPVDVVWTSPQKENPRGMGLRFLNVDEPTREQLDSFILSFLRRRLSKTNAVTKRPSVDDNKRNARRN